MIMKTVILSMGLLLLHLFLNCKGCVDEEREALLQIKNSMNSPDGTAFPNWYGEDCCRWEGVECAASTSLVVKIFFQYRRGRNEEYWYPNASLFAQFKGLQELHLAGNRIGGFITPNALHKLEHLQKLDLRDNAISSGSNLRWGNMPALHFLDLSRNKLQGDIPKCLCKSRFFTNLQLSHNELSGSMDACFSNMTSLEHLDLSNNLFGRRFPSMLFHNLTNIKSLIISDNNFQDMISFSIFANLSKLNFLDISHNTDLEVETESPNWSPSFDLKVLNLGGCELNKNSGKHIPSFISTQYHLQVLNLSHNSLVGTIPSWLFYNVSSELWLGGNNFTGLFPVSEKINMSSHLAVLDISNNTMHGPLPADINLIFPGLRHLDASMNNFNGSLPQSFGEMEQLQFLDLSDNMLQGKLPPWNSSWRSLNWLYLDGNQFSGLFPDNLANSSSLLILIISNNGFSGDLSRNLFSHLQLRVLILRGNRFRGKIPPQLCQMKYLRILDLSKNSLSGDIPTCLNNITSLAEEAFNPQFRTYSWVGAVTVRMKGVSYEYSGPVLPFLYVIDISSNKLTGTIPPQISDLRAMVSLNMSSNHLTGQIPASLANLERLESLDLSHNRFFDVLPQNLTELSSLSWFDVSFNNLSGPVPARVAQFATFDKSSYMGNPSLCGPPLAKVCHQLVVVEGRRPSNLCSTLSTTSVLILWSTFFFFVVIVY